MPCPGLNLPGQFLGRLAGGFQLEGFGGLVAGVTQVVRRKIESAQHQVRIGAG
jgi:hypothetical protein